MVNHTRFETSGEKAGTVQSMSAVLADIADSRSHGAVSRLTICALILLASQALQAADKPLKVFILAGQSNMVGWGDSTKLPADLRNGNDRVLMFENGKWQPLKPIRKAQANQERLGMTEFTFGPEIAFGHEMAKAWPEATIGIIKFAIRGNEHTDMEARLVQRSIA
jgi:hypothetical protein